tara:strand:- start:1272 stop:1589 length:318 start_codon:yes stop_codon:yes gene_type:complete
LRLAGDPALQGDDLRGSSVLDDPREHRKWSPEQLLLKRMLDDALKGASEGDDVDRGWLLSEYTVEEGSFSFIDVCQYLHLDPEWIRRQLRSGNWGRPRRILVIDE